MADPAGRNEMEVEMASYQYVRGARIVGPVPTSRHDIRDVDC